MNYVWMSMLVSRNIMYNVNQQQAKVFALKSYQPLMGQLVLMQLRWADVVCWTMSYVWISLQTC